MEKKSITVVAISDSHGTLPPSHTIPKCDLLLIGGDICGHHGTLDQSIWLHKEFKPWLENIQAKKIVGVAGNHDFIWEKAPHLVPQLPWTYLQDSSCMYEGWKIYGSPWQLRFFDWAFNLDEPQLAARWRLIPEDTDILLLHGPPKYFGDKVNRIRPGEDGFVGSPSLTEKIMEIKPKLVIFGHIHPGFGVYETVGVTMANVSILDDQYAWRNAPTEFVLNPESRTTTAKVRLLKEEKAKEKIIQWDVENA